MNSQPDGDEIQDDDGKTLHIEQKIVRLSKDFTFPKLQMYFVSNCNKLEVGTKKEDEFFGRSRCLMINYCEAASLSIFSTLCQNLKFLNLKRIIGLHNIVPSIDEGGLNELTHLFVNYCEDLECIADASQSPH